MRLLPLVWSHNSLRAARSGAFFVFHSHHPTGRHEPRCPARSRIAPASHHLLLILLIICLARFVEVLTKCRVHLWRGDARFVAAGAWGNRATGSAQAQDVAFPVKRLVSFPTERCPACDCRDVFRDLAPPGGRGTTTPRAPAEPGRSLGKGLRPVASPLLPRGGKVRAFRPDTPARHAALDPHR